MFSLFRHFKKLDWLFLFIAAGLIVLQVYLELLMPEYTENLTVFVTSAGTDQSEVWKNGGMMLLCAGGSLLSAITCSFFISYVASDFSATLREKLYRHILSFSNKEIHHFHTASLITRTTNDIVQVQNFVAMGTQMLIKAPLMAIWAIIKISNSNLSWTLATVIVIVIIAIVVVLGIIFCIPKFTKIQKLTDDLNERARENVSGVRIVRAFNAEEHQKTKYENVNNEITGTHLFVSRITGLLMPVLNLAMNGLTLVIYWIAALLINNIALDTSSTAAMMEGIAERANVIAKMTVFSQYSMQVIMSFLMLMFVFLILPRTLVSAKRIKEVLKTESTIKDGENNRELQENEIPAIVFDHVNFSYAGDSHYAVSDINFVINKGETVAFIGSTGCGKTTLINLLLRYYDVTSGEVMVNGVDVRNYTLSGLRKKFSYAPQKASLLKGTIKSNVGYGQREIDEDRLGKALSCACCDFVNELEKGVDSEVAQGGHNYSGGQRQRLSIARAIYKDADILVFDDTFSALDFKTDSQVRRNIHNECEGKTVLIVAQRIGTIRNADKIVVMDKGKVVGIGTHEELIKSNDVYREIALSQLSEEEL
ncbi:MAG: ABC transporter ATP-binding protein/permease [Bacilli bacterium]|nr:ABC transporter ATP-binding protein/permease [Bacilli bacterium]